MVDVFYYDAFLKTINPEPEGGPFVRHSAFAELAAENERLTKLLGDAQQALRDEITAHGNTIRACTGTVKVKALEWEEREERRLDVTTEKFWRAQTAFDWGYCVKVYGKGFSFDNATGYPTIDAAKAAAQTDYELRIFSALEPVASESQQPVAYRIHAPEDEYYGVGPDRLQFHPLSQYELDCGYRQTPLYTRPAEQGGK